MRLIKMLGLASVAAVAAMAFLGASSAMATFNTTLCTENSVSLVCPEGKEVKLFDMLAGTTTLKTKIGESEITVLCLHSKVKLENENVLGVAPVPLLIKVEEKGLAWENCGTNAEHNNCTVTTEVDPLFEVLKTAANLGTAATTKGEVHVVCPLINCFYGGVVKGFTVESSGHTAGSESGMFTANELSVPKTKGTFCPTTSKWTALYKPMHLGEKGELLELPLWLRE